MSALELVATALGLASVWLTVRRSLWLWPTGIAMVVLYAVVFARARLFSNVLLQLVFLVLQVYGWWHWTRRREGAREAPVVRVGAAALAAWSALALVLALPLGFAMGTWAGASRPYWDATVTTLSLAAQWLLARKALESWLLWMAVDVLSIGLYAVQGLLFTTGLYVVFLGMAVQGFREWRVAR